MNALDVLAVADEIERLGHPKCAARLRLAAVDGDDPERTAPVQEPSGGEVSRIPWGLHALLWTAYGHDQTAERLAERGGFGRAELGWLAVGMYGSAGGERHRRADRNFVRSYPLLDLYRVAAGAGLVP